MKTTDVSAVEVMQLLNGQKNMPGMDMRQLDLSEEIDSDPEDPALTVHD